MISTKGGKKDVKMTVTQIGDDEIKVIAADEAGNQTEEVIPFLIVEKGPLRKFYDNKPLFAGTIARIAIVRRSRNFRIQIHQTAQGKQRN